MLDFCICFGESVNGRFRDGSPVPYRTVFAGFAEQIHLHYP